MSEYVVALWTAMHYLNTSHIKAYKPDLFGITFVSSGKLSKWVNQGSSDLKNEPESKRTKEQCWLIVTKKESTFIIYKAQLKSFTGRLNMHSRTREANGIDLYAIQMYLIMGWTKIPCCF